MSIWKRLETCIDYFLVNLDLHEVMMTQNGPSSPMRVVTEKFPVIGAQWHQKNPW